MQGFELGAAKFLLANTEEWRKESLKLKIFLYYPLLQLCKKSQSHSKNCIDCNNSELNSLLPHMFDFALKTKEDNWHRQQDHIVYVLKKKFRATRYSLMRVHL